MYKQEQIHNYFAYSARILYSHSKGGGEVKKYVHQQRMAPSRIENLTELQPTLDRHQFGRAVNVGTRKSAVRTHIVVHS